MRASAALLAALKAPAVQYAKAEIRPATLGERVRYDGRIRSYLVAALIAFVGACLGIVAALPHSPAWAKIASAAAIAVGLAWAAAQRLRSGD